MSFINFLCLSFLFIIPKAFSLDHQTISFVLDGKPAPIPDDIQKTLSRLNTNEIGAEIGILNIFAANQRYKNLKLYIPEDPRYQWQLEANRVTKVFEINISGLGFLEESSYKSGFRLKPGQPFQTSHLEWDKAHLINRLQQRGYPGAKVLNVNLDYKGKDSVSIDFLVEKGRPCRIAEVRISPPRFLNLLTNPIEPGSICDKSQIEDALEREGPIYSTKVFTMLRFNLMASPTLPTKKGQWFAFF